MQVGVNISGPLACFTAAVTPVERVSYPVITPSAARGTVESVMWRPEMRYIVERIEILRPIRYLSLPRLEVNKKIKVNNVISWMKDPSRFTPLGAERTQRGSMVLADVSYNVFLRIEVLDDAGGQNTPQKYAGMLDRRVKKGQWFTSPYLGCREFAATVSPIDSSANPQDINENFGWVLYDILYRNKKWEPLFFEAKVKGGVVDTRPEQALQNAQRREEYLK